MPASSRSDRPWDLASRIAAPSHQSMQGRADLVADVGQEGGCLKLLRHVPRARAKAFRLPVRAEQGHDHDVDLDVTAQAPGDPGAEPRRLAGAGGRQGVVRSRTRLFGPAVAPSAAGPAADLAGGLIS